MNDILSPLANHARAWIKGTCEKILLSINLMEIFTCPRRALAVIYRKSNNDDGEWQQSAN